MTELRDHLANEYVGLTGDITDDVEHAWRALEDETNSMLSHVLNRLRPDFVEGQPYDSALSMCEDMESGVLKVSVDFNTHPIWTPEHNLVFRFVHDAVGHWGLGTTCNPFSFKGELRAYAEQSSHITNEDAKRALHTEVVGQAAYRGTFGVFPKQKLGFIS